MFDVNKSEADFILEELQDEFNRLKVILGGKPAALSQGSTIERITINGQKLRFSIGKMSILLKEAKRLSK